MPTCHNGWPVLESSRTTGNLPRLRRWTIAPTGQVVALRDGSAGFILTHLASWFHDNIEPIDRGVFDDWGYAYRAIRGGTRFSNHAGGVAIDVNATQHPLGVSIDSTFSEAEQAKIRSQLRYYDGIITWGGDYNGRPDGMHFELSVGSTLDQAERVAAKLMGTERGQAILAANPGAKAVISDGNQYVTEGVPPKPRPKPLPEPKPGTPTTTVAAMALNAPRKERKGLLVNAAQVAVIVSLARRRKVGIVMLQEVYAGQRRAWAKRRGWHLIEATPNNARGELGNAIAVRRRYARVLTQAEIKVPGPGYPLHFPVGTLQLKPYNSRLRGLVKQGWQMPTVAVCGAHFPRKTVLPFQARKAMAQAIARWIKGSEVPVIVGLDANDRRLFPHLGTESNVNHGIDGVGFTGEFTNAHGGAITNRGIRRITDHRHAVIGRARLRLSR